MSGVSGVSTPKVNPPTVLLDEVSDTLTYIGKAAAGSDTSAPVWQVSRLGVTGTLTALNYADGAPLYNQVWDDRASLSYS